MLGTKLFNFGIKRIREKLEKIWIIFWKGNQGIIDFSDEDINNEEIALCVEKVRKLREKVDSGKVDLSEYEDMADEFTK